jgi:hypothetical protein
MVHALEPSRLRPVPARVGIVAGLMLGATDAWREPT